MRTREHIPALDGLRGLAVVLVLISHSPTLWRHIAIQFPALGAWNITAEWVGAFGVDLFFALSGFLICRILLFNREQGISLATFWRGRVARIFPLAYLVIVLTAFAWPSAQHIAAAAFGANWFSVLGGDTTASPLGHYWSLAIEEQWYFVAPFIIYFVAENRARLIFTLLVVAMLSWHLSTALLYDGALSATITERATHTRGWPLAFGAVIAFHESHFRAAWWRLPLLAVGLCVVASRLPVAVETFEAVAGGKGQLAKFQFSVVRSLLACALFCAVLGDRSTPLNALLTHPWPRWVGKISYGLYVYHIPVYLMSGGMEALGHPYPFGASAWSSPLWMTGVAIVATFAIAAVSYRWFETPAAQAIKAWRWAGSGGAKKNPALAG